MIERMNKLMYEYINIWMNQWINEWINEWMYERMNKWMNEWMNERMNEWMNINQLMNPWINASINLIKLGRSPILLLNAYCSLCIILYGSEAMHRFRYHYEMKVINETDTITEINVQGATIKLNIFHIEKMKI